MAIRKTHVRAKLTSEDFLHLLDGLYFDNDKTIDAQVDPIRLIDFNSSVFDRKVYLTLDTETPTPQFMARQAS